MQIYAFKDGEQIGPYDPSQISSLVKIGTLSAKDLIWWDGEPSWRPIETAPFFGQKKGGAANPSGEVTLHSARLSIWRPVVITIAASPFLLMLAFSIIMKAFPHESDYLSIAVFFFCLLSWIRNWTSEISITNKRVLVRVGVIRRRSIEMFVSKIESISIDQGLLGRLFNYGTVIICGTGGTKEKIYPISDPAAFRNQAQAARDGK